MNEIFHLRGKIKRTQKFIFIYIYATNHARSITSSGFYSIIYESCQLFIQLTKIEKSKRVTLLDTMLKMLWPFCMLKVPLCWWLVWWQVLVWTNKDLCVGGVQTLGGTPEPETHCAACPALHSPPWRHLHTNSASHYRHTTPSATPPPQVPPPPRYPLSSLAPSHVLLVPRLDAIHLSKLF